MNYKPVIDFIRSLYPSRNFIPLHEPYFGGNEKKYVLDCIDSTYVSSVGKYVDLFEKMIQEFTGVKRAVATVNGTAALHIALLLAGVKPGDLVITQPLTFIATCNAISYCGADPVFVDIDRDTLGMSPEALEQWLSENVVIEGIEGREGLDGLASSTQLSQPVALYKWAKRPISACIPMHTFGHPCRIDRIIEICDRYHIPVVEDSAESIGSYYEGQHTGTFGKLGILSFNGNKTITTGGGGMVLTNDEELGKLAKHITTTAKKPHPWLFEHDMTGYNYRLPNINAAIGCAQMEMLPEMIRSKRDLAQRYQDYFLDLPEIEYITEPSNSISNYWLNCILLPDEQARNRFLQETNDQKVMTRPAWILMNQLKMFETALCGGLVTSMNIVARLVNIPSSIM
ncbi:MAG: LegC family aminotransferase [Candidatus Cloacimonetes bacterium]|nr:LegC family aminotransferase [Candidatus Cloacimonadota bacterium]